VGTFFQRGNSRRKWGLEKRGRVWGVLPRDSVWDPWPFLRFKKREGVREAGGVVPSKGGGGQCRHWVVFLAVAVQQEK